jgi:hypothetical protein
MARFDLTDFEWSVIQPLLPNKPRGVPRVDDRRVLNGIFWRPPPGGSMSANSTGLVMSRRRFTVLGLAASGESLTACQAGELITCMFNLSLSVVCRGKTLTGSSIFGLRCYPTLNLDGMGSWAVALRGASPVVNLGADGVLLGLLGPDPLDEIGDGEVAPMYIKDLPFAIVDGPGVTRQPGEAGRGHPDITLSRLNVGQKIRLSSALLPRLAWLPNPDDANSRIFSDGDELKTRTRGVVVSVQGTFERLDKGKPTPLHSPGQWTHQLHVAGPETRTDDGLLVSSVIADEH